MTHPAVHSENITTLIFLHTPSRDHEGRYTLSFTTESFASHSETSIYMIIHFDSNTTGIIKGYITGKSQNLIDHIENIAGTGHSPSSSVKNTSHLNGRSLNENTRFNAENLQSHKCYMICRIDGNRRLTYVRLIDDEVLNFPNIRKLVYKRKCPDCRNLYNFPGQIKSHRLKHLGIR
ncbi:628_t:CDS:1, partial [Acaulospora morrowiae]